MIAPRKVELRQRSFSDTTVNYCKGTHRILACGISKPIGPHLTTEYVLMSGEPATTGPSFVLVALIWSLAA